MTIWDELLLNIAKQHGRRSGREVSELYNVAYVNYLEHLDQLANVEDCDKERFVAGQAHWAIRNFIARDRAFFQRLDSKMKYKERTVLPDIAARDYDIDLHIDVCSLARTRYEQILAKGLLSGLSFKDMSEREHIPERTLREKWYEFQRFLQRQL